MTDEATPAASQAALKALAPKAWEIWRDKIPYSKSTKKQANAFDFIRDAVTLDGVPLEQLREPFRAAVVPEMRDIIPDAETWAKWYADYIKGQARLAKEAEAKAAAEAEALAAEEAARKPRRFEPLARGNRKPKAIRYLIDGLIVAGQAFQLFGPRGAGKTFCALDMGLCIATGRPWHGRKVQQGRVVHIISEGNEDGLWNRVDAWVLANGKTETERAELSAAINANWRMIPRAVHIDRPDVLDEFLEELGDDWALVVIDPLLRVMTGDTNTTRDMGAFIEAIDDIRSATGGAVLVVHHEGKDKSKGPLGSISLGAAVDGEARFSDEGGRHVFQITKLRDDKTDQPKLAFKLVDVTIDDSDFPPITSAALRLDKKAVRATITQDDLADLISERKPGSVADLIAMTDAPERTVYRLLKALRAEGRAGMLQD